MLALVRSGGARGGERAMHRVACFCGLWISGSKRIAYKAAPRLAQSVPQECAIIAHLHTVVGGRVGSGRANLPLSPHRLRICCHLPAPCCCCESNRCTLASPRPPAKPPNFARADPRRPSCAGRAPLRRWTVGAGMACLAARAAPLSLSLAPCHCGEDAPSRDRVGAAQSGKGKQNRILPAVRPSHCGDADALGRGSGRR